MASGTAFIPTPPVLVSLAFHRSLLSFILPYSSHTVISLSLISSFPFIFKYFIDSAEHLLVYHLYFNPFITLRTSRLWRCMWGNFGSEKPCDLSKVTTYIPDSKYVAFSLVPLRPLSRSNLHMMVLCLKYCHLHYE